MLPPSDSINHQNLKLAEFLASLQNQPALPAPPPPYTAVQTNDDLDLDDEEEDPLPPIVLKIDSSIVVDGQANTIAIPASFGPNLENGNTAPSELRPTVSNSGAMQQLQQQRQVKSAQIASSVMAAMKASGILNDRETGMSRPIEIHINSGIHVKGVKNVVCLGLKRRTEANSPPTTPCEAREGGRKRRAQSEPIELPNPKKRSI
ncbi:uncharacterized protein CIMG_04210 [Coccidioides immitis RS]|uniref:Uncharacterized protein n=3 Tax=Coccidioides immitis TaxID=5501 RepID=J3KD13_COCIM|nr:uncharacterized protein CIMG_04210 [Coccidioides immitis RS]EAS33186.3 hypothetical protein CIMG_04210 [Coccidioides immitis RS]KMP08482.1 hypothetical protein CIRG_08163 [Coccidioides immitis RMSCC 2394]KMU72262.1 hypothetical protein CISG_02911 [Coccidioides immitis RMSCC 3703]